MKSQARNRQEQDKKVESLVGGSLDSLTDLVPALSTHLAATFPLVVPAALLLPKRDALDRLASDIWNAATRLGREQQPEGTSSAERDKKAWKQSRLDLAEHMFSKSDLDPHRLAADTVDMLTDTLFEIGRDMFSKRQYEDAVRWLDRAYDLIGERNVEELDHDAVELRLSILNFLVRACLKMNTTESREKARGIVDLLDFDYGDKMVVHLLKLDVISSDPELEVEQYYNVVVRMIRSIVLTDANFRTVMHHAHIIKGKSPELACKALDKLLHEKLFSHENHQWIEKVAVTQIWILADSGDAQPPESLVGLLEAVLQNSRPFDAPATHAAQTILWKKIETLYSQAKYLESESWCNIALHPLFAKAGDSNKAKISRKIILCALSRQEHNNARKVFFQLPENEKNNPMTRYLMYKSAIRDQEPHLAAECLDAISRQPGRDCTLLYACVVEAQELRDQQSAIIALQKALEKYDYGAPTGVHLPALLRSTIRLLVNQMSASSDFKEDALKEVCKVFEGAAVQATKDRTPRPDMEQSEPIFTEKELEWFSRNSYNLALKHCGSAHPEHLLCLLDKCIQFIGLLQTALSKTNSSGPAPDLILRLLLCHYLASCAAIVLARSTDSVTESLNAYITASRHACAFRNTVSPLLNTSASTNGSGSSTNTNQPIDLGVATKADLAAKRAQLLRYELESALKRSDWDGLDALWDECFDNPLDAAGSGAKESRSSWYTRHLETLADLALVIHSELSKVDTSSASTTTTTTRNHRARVLGVLQRIVNQSCSGSIGTGISRSGAVVHLARWIRCLFQLSIDSSNALEDPDAIPLQCIGQATSLISASSSSTTGARREMNRGASGDDYDDYDEARGGGGSGSHQRYPQIEAEWLASTAFNRGIDFYSAGDDARYKVWAEKAIGLARVAEEQRAGGGSGGQQRREPGGLYGTLMERSKGLLRWD
ncbi:sporulation-specific protein 22 [Diplodia seriata]|uniref:Sporulation-specific protein 22 n=1 Tax=Diplodia seriata TaxID=420778 RepID=A0ABR3CE74_9PEZI